MKLINFLFLSKKEQLKEKSLILEEGDIIHILVNKQLNSEFVITCKNNKLTILPRKKGFTTHKKKDNLD